MYGVGVGESQGLADAAARAEIANQLRVVVRSFFDSRLREYRAGWVSADRRGSVESQEEVEAVARVQTRQADIELRDVRIVARHAGQVAHYSLARLDLSSYVAQATEHVRAADASLAHSDHLAAIGSYLKAMRALALVPDGQADGRPMLPQIEAELARLAARLELRVSPSELSVGRGSEEPLSVAVVVAYDGRAAGRVPIAARLRWGGREDTVVVATDTLGQAEIRFGNLGSRMGRGTLSVRVAWDRLAGEPVVVPPWLWDVSHRDIRVTGRGVRLALFASGNSQASPYAPAAMSAAITDSLVARGYDVLRVWSMSGDTLHLLRLAREAGCEYLLLARVDLVGQAPFRTVLAQSSATAAMVVFRVSNAEAVAAARVEDLRAVGRTPGEAHGRAASRAVTSLLEQLDVPAVRPP